MRFHSTRNAQLDLTSAQAITRGLAQDGGLFVPEAFPSLTARRIEELCSMDYPSRAAVVMGMFLEDFSAQELVEFTARAYGAQFDDPAVAPVRLIDRNTAVLELWHGPTSAFKDMALQMLPLLLTASMKKTGEQRRVCILTATSGDTGKAALEGFRNVPGTKIMVFYPKNGVSDVQALQMTSQEGDNVGVSAVTGNFDDAQSGVKAIFSDAAFREELDARGWFLSSANSINLGRLLPQVVYYVSAYCDMVTAGMIGMGAPVNFCVPTGNFGNILAGFYAKQMGLPIGKLICASNANDVLTDFIRTGTYDRNRPFFTTISPSMDILVSSNLERMLFHLSDGDDSFVRSCMDGLTATGRYTVPEHLMLRMRETFACGCCGEEDTKEQIAKIFRDHGCLIDTHTAVAYHVLEEYRTSTCDMTPSAVVSTASPYKFCGAVLEAIGGEARGSGVELIDRLAERSGAMVPAPLAALKGKRPRFTQCIEKQEMLEAVRRFIG